MIFALIVSFAACSDNQNQANDSEKDISDVAGEYYIDLTDLGMKLTIYLKIAPGGSFMFSNTTQFAVNKSSGTVEKSGNEYLMIYTSVNGEDKSISDGLNSKFVRQDDGSLDFTVCERIYYGTAGATSTSDNNPDAKLIARILPADYQAPSDESDFTAENGIVYRYRAGFFEDSGYLIFCSYKDGDFVSFLSEVGRYGVSTTQLALNPQDGNRISCDVLGADKLSISVPLVGSDERTVLTFDKSDVSEAILSFDGEGTKTGTNEKFTAVLTVYANGVFESESADFKESGLIAIDSENKTFKIYPDHPTEHIRGTNQVTTVPTGRFLQESDGKISLLDFRVRLSESLNRDKCDFKER